MLARRLGVFKAFRLRRLDFCRLGHDPIVIQEAFAFRSTGIVLAWVASAILWEKSQSFRGFKLHFSNSSFTYVTFTLGLWPPCQPTAELARWRQKGTRQSCHWLKTLLNCFQSHFICDQPDSFPPHLPPPLPPSPPLSSLSVQLYKVIRKREAE